MKIHFIKANPTENMTIFVLDQIPQAMYSDVAKKIMCYGNIHAEQVGFVEKPKNADGKAAARLHMMGGEFCVNAVRALAAMCVERGDVDAIDQDGSYTIWLEVSGLEDAQLCHVHPLDKGSFRSSIRMPHFKSIKQTTLEFDQHCFNGTWVEFPGINHLVIDGTTMSSRDKFFENIKQSLQETNYDAFGIMFWNETCHFLEPLVYVRQTESKTWERGCGSGTAAVGIALSHRLKMDIDIDICQPGGNLNVRTDWKNNAIESVYLSGDVRIVGEGIAYV